MIIYHGSNKIIEKPDLNHSRCNIDFGRGFYTTSYYDQAKNWSLKFKEKGYEAIVNFYKFDKSKFSYLNVLEFTDYSSDWLDLIVKCRRENYEPNYDIIIGSVANDRVFNVIELFIDRLIEAEECIKRLKLEEPNLQICFKSSKSLKLLKFLKAEKIC